MGTRNDTKIKGDLGYYMFSFVSRSPFGLGLIMSLIFFAGCSVPFVSSPPKAPPPSLEEVPFEEVDVSKTQCPEIPAARERVKIAYQKNLGLLKEFIARRKEYLDSQLQQCILDSQRSPEATDCDGQWTEVQKAHERASKDPTNQGAYAEYQRVKQKWDACYAEAKKREKKEAVQPKEWECYDIYRLAVGLLKDNEVELLSTLLAEVESQKKFLDELEKKCVPEKKIEDGIVGEDVVEKRRAQIDVSKTQCHEIVAKRVVVKEIFEHNRRGIEEFFHEFADLANSLRTQCQERAKTQEELDVCESKYLEFMKKILADYANDMEREVAERDERLKYLDELEKKCAEAATKKTEGKTSRFNPDDTPTIQYKILDLSQTQCPDISARRLDVKRTHANNIKSAQAWYEYRLQLAKYNYNNRMQTAKTDKEKKDASRWRTSAEDSARSIYHQDLKIDDIIRDRSLQFLDDLEKKCVTKIISDTEEKKPQIKVIRYQGKHLPVEFVHTFTGASKEECDAEEHWHANAGSVRATDGTVMVDPGGCGYGKTKANPVIEIELGF